MGSLSINGTLSLVPDPDYVSFGTRVVGAFVGGVPVRQGLESGVLNFPPLSSGMRNQLYSRYLANKNSRVSGALPALSAYGWEACSAAFGEPHFGGFQGEWAMSANMIVYFVSRY